MKDQLSALIDGEFDLDSANHLFSSIKKGGELKQSWAQYHLIGDVMRGESALSADFSARVMLALSDEPIIFAPNHKYDDKHVAYESIAKKGLQANKFWSIAASVAAVYFVSIVVFQQKFHQTDSSSPVEIAQGVGLEYLQAHQAVAPNNAAYYIQNANYVDGKSK